MRASHRIPVSLRAKLVLLKAFIATAIDDIKYHRKVSASLPADAKNQTVPQLKLLARYGITAKEYYLFDLWKQAHTSAESEQYIGALGSYLWQIEMGDVGYATVFDDKLLFDVIARNAGLAVPEILCVYSDTAPSLDHTVARTWDELEQWLKTSDAENIFIKPLRGIMGAGAMSLGSRHVGDDGMPCWDRLPKRTSPITLSEIRDRTDKFGEQQFVLQKRLNPSEQTSRYSADVLQTMRIVTFNSGDNPSIVAAALKISSGKRPIDNLLRGENLIAPIDLDSGRLGAAVKIEEDGQHWHDIHPITEQAIEGVVIDQWPEILELTKRAACVFPWFKSIGWDIALTDAGPMVIEANYHADMMLIQLSHQQSLLKWPIFNEAFEANDLYRYVGLNGVF